MDHETLAIVIAAVAGLIAGSAITALAARVIAEESWVRGRSRCQSCRRELAAADLIPVLSYLLLRGKCRYCRKPIGWQYPAIELVTTALFVLFAAFEPFSGALVRDWLIVAVLIAVFVVDARASIIPDELMIPALIGAVVWSISFHTPEPTLMAIGAAVGGGFFALQYFISRGKWIGGGDIRLGAFLGAVLGWPLVLPALLLAYWSGAAVGIGLVVVGRKKWGSEIPFGTFLSAAGVAVLLYEAFTR